MKRRSKIALPCFLVAACLIWAPSSFADETLGGDAIAGQALFENMCQECHGASGKGDGPGAADFYLKPRDFAVATFKFDTDADWQRGTDVDLANVIKNGADVFGGSALMPAWDLEEEEIKALVAYIRSLAG